MVGPVAQWGSGTEWGVGGDLSCGELCGDDHARAASSQGSSESSESGVALRDLVPVLEFCQRRETGRQYPINGAMRWCNRAAWERPFTGVVTGQMRLLSRRRLRHRSKSPMAVSMAGAGDGERGRRVRRSDASASVR